MGMNLAILLSGGTGSRIRTEVPKQYVRIGGRMLITYALEPLLASPFVDWVEVVAEEAWRDAILEDVWRAGLATGKIAGFSAPGRNRQESILSGMRGFLLRRNGRAEAEDIGGADTVLVHDAARPLLGGEMIEACHTSLVGHDGVMPVLPMKDTVYRSRSGVKVEGLLERGHIYAGQAPELFLLKKYFLANLAFLPEAILAVSGSTEPAVMAGMDIAMVPGDEGNFKVTTEADLEKFREHIEKFTK